MKTSGDSKPPERHSLEHKHKTVWPCGHDIGQCLPITLKECQKLPEVIAASRILTAWNSKDIVGRELIPFMESILSTYANASRNYLIIGKEGFLIPCYHVVTKNK